MSNDVPLLPEDAPIEDFLTYKIRILYLLSGRKTTRFLAGSFDLALIEWWLLGQLAVHSPATVTDLVDLTMHDKAQVSRGVRKLVDRGYASRSENPDDARSAFYQISEKGMQVYREIIPHRVAAQRELLAVMSADERRIVEKALDRLIDHLADDAQSA